MGSNQENSLEKTIQQSYRLAALTLKPYGPIWRVQSPAGCFILKPVKQNPAAIRGLDSNLRQIRAAGFDGVPEIFTQRNGEPFMEHAGRCYILMPWYPGENPSFQIPKHLERIITLYGLFHSTALKVAPSRDFTLQTLTEEFSKRIVFLETAITQLRQIQLDAPHRINRIDRTILSWGDYFLRQAVFCHRGLARLAALNFQVPAGFCHNDPAPRNMIIQSPEWKLIDFELGGENLFVRELTVLMLRILAANAWESQSVRNALNVYAKKRPIADVEMMIFPYLMGFPQGFWRLCSQRYAEKLPRKEHYFQEKLWTAIHQEPQRLIALVSLCPELKEWTDLHKQVRLNARDCIPNRLEAKEGISCPE